MDTTTCNNFRNHFGALMTFPSGARDLLIKAIATDKLSPEYNAVAWNRRRQRAEGWCLNYDCYDVTPSAILVQRRETLCDKYGSHPTKNYYVIRKCGRGVTVTEAPKARVAKLAKVSTHLGDIIDTIEGRAKRPLKQAAPFSQKDVAYKIVEARDGSFWSVFDSDCEWALGKARIEAATDDHTGGYYVFPTVEAAKSALSNNLVFKRSWQDGKALVLLECDIAGRREQHDHGKLCVSFCRPLRVLESLERLAA
jgi:hypothetical protein